MTQKYISEQLTNRFPEYASQITYLLSKNMDFREIAEDYEYCMNKVKRLSAGQGENEPLIHHYQNTMHELEDEMMEYFSI